MPNNDRTEQAAVYLWVRMARVYSRLAQAIQEDLRGHGLTMAQFDVIAQVGSAPGLTQDDLARRLLVTKGNVTQLLNRMEHKGWVQRERDARCNRIMLTDAGQDVYDNTVAEHEAFVAARYDGLTVDERRQLAALLRKLDRSLRGADD